MKKFVITKASPTVANFQTAEGAYVNLVEVPPQFQYGFSCETGQEAIDHYGLTRIVRQPVTPPPPNPRQILASAESRGIDVPFGEGTVRMLCGDRDRALFASALTLYRTHEDLLPDEQAKEAFRNSTVTFSDADGHPHEVTVQQARQLLVVYGAMYQAIWAAAAEFNNQPTPP